MMEYSFGFVAVDFDGTLCEDAFPEIGKPRQDVIDYIKRLAEGGAKIILYTSREDGPNTSFLTDAVKFCKDHEIPLFAVNENPGNPYPEMFGTPHGRKVFADVYIDDKAMHPDEISQPNIVCPMSDFKGVCLGRNCSWWDSNIKRCGIIRMTETLFDHYVPLYFTNEDRDHILGLIRHEMQKVYEELPAPVQRKHKANLKRVIIPVILILALIIGGLWAFHTAGTVADRDTTIDALKDKNRMLAFENEQIKNDYWFIWEDLIAAKDAAQSAGINLARAESRIDDMATDACWFEGLGKFRISYYTQGEAGVDNITATGAEVHKGIVAVDPSVIPLHSEIYISNIGWCVAEDVGGAIKGKRIDIYVENIADIPPQGIDFENVYIKHTGGLE